ncbi:polyphosphate kinase 2 family protein [Pseudomonas helleri]|uniref:polyphosphate kinase 2 family protein n=1 Tax=Pseudomonas helleri TaxID=1608996 RepID=UPI00242FBA18|nr:polyphosphate kinase 2 family protein [Pseudomonas helleri]
MSLISKLIVKPGSKIRLADVDPDFHGSYKSEKDAQKHLDQQSASISDLQKKLYAERKHSLLIVLQGIDAAGKDGTCWHVLRSMNPQGTNVHGFKQPTAEESSHDFLWRVHPHVPADGNVAIFNRSHYEDVLVQRVHKMAPGKVIEKRYDLINAFESTVHSNNTTILKFFLYISPEEQLRRFEERLDDPMRQWKISEGDYSERALWDDYIKAYEAMLNKCSTDHAPWYVIPANHKWFRNLAVGSIVEKTLKDMKMQLPKPTVDLKEIRRKYHQAKKEKL